MIRIGIKIGTDENDHDQEIGKKDRNLEVVKGNPGLEVEIGKIDEEVNQGLYCSRIVSIYLLKAFFSIFDCYLQISWSRQTQ